MPRVIVTSDPTRIPPHSSVLLDEQVSSIHLGSGHAAAQLIERLAWAISDAEEAERARASSSPAPAAGRLPRKARAHTAGSARRRSRAAA